jgi:hypothetical protein
MIDPRSPPDILLAGCRVDQSGSGAYLLVGRIPNLRVSQFNIFIY